MCRNLRRLFLYAGYFFHFSRFEIRYSILIMDLLDVAIEAAKKGGAVISDYFETSIKREVKADKSFVTAADRDAERAILSVIQKHLPDHGILSEESE